MPSSLLPSLSHTPPGSSTASTPRASSSALAPVDIQPAPPTYSEEEELQDNYRGRYNFDFDHPSVRVTSTDVEEKSSSQALSSNDFNDRMVSTFRSRSRSPAPSFLRDEGELRLQTFDQPLSHSWWNEEKHVVRPKKKTEQTEALQSTRKVSNDIVILRWVCSSRAASEWVFLRHPDVNQ